MHKAPQPVRLRRCYVDRLFVLLVGVHAQVGVDEAVDIAVHDGLNVAVFIAGAMVLGQRVRHEHVRADLAAPLDLELHALDVGDLLRVLLNFELHELGFEHLHGVVAVLELAALCLAGSDDAGGDMNETHRRRGLIDVLAARAALHHWEEPCLSGDPNAATGSGTVFFTGCTLQCCYCQNYKISQQGLGKPLTAERLAEIFMELQQKGAKNLNLVTATQWLPWVTQALDAARRNGLTLPVAYNTGGYETVETVKALAGYVDIWLADYKYASPALAKELSAAQDYPQVAHAAIRQMLLQTGAPVYDADGYLQKGVIVRHLALPGHSDDSLAVLQRLADLRQETGVSFVPSLMSQFTPFYRAAEHGLGRRITTYEYRKVVDRAIALGLTDGYMQEKSSAREEYTPPFDLEGV